jgi:sulfur carrier protein
MQVRINGTMQSVPSGSSVADIMAQLYADAALEGIAVALNGKVLRRAAWPATELSAGDEIEVVQAVAGG